MSRYELPAGKRVTIYRSGDMHYPGATMTVNPMHVKNLENFLNQVTLKVDPSWGAVRSIHTPNTGTVLNTLGDITKKGNYVAAGPKGFVSVPGGYGNAGKPGFSRKKFMNQKVITKRVLPKLEILSLHIYRNGVKDDVPIHFRTREKELENWSSFLYKLSDKLRLAQGPVTRLYTLEGRIIKSGEQLQHQGVYVAAASNETFRKIQYGRRHSEEIASSTVLADKDIAEKSKAKEAKPAEQGFKPKLPVKRTVQRRRSIVEDLDKNDNESENFNIDGTPKSPLPRVKKEPPVVSNPYQRPQPKRNNTQQGLTRQDSEQTIATENRSVYDLPDNVPEGSDLSAVDYLNLQTPQPPYSLDPDDHTTPRTQIPSRPTSPRTHRPASPQSHMEFTRSRASSFYSNRGDTSYLSDTIAEEIEHGHTSRHPSPRVQQQVYGEEEEDLVYTPRLNTRQSLTDSGNASLLSDEDGLDGPYGQRPTTVLLPRPDSVFKAKGSRPATTFIEVDYDTDDGGIFKSKRNTAEYLRGTKEVLDSSGTKIELPVDMSEAAEVQLTVISVQRKK